MLVAFIALYILVTLLIGWYSSRFVKDSKDFVLAGRKMPAFVVASGLFATWFGSETVMGASSEFYRKGLLGVIEDPFGSALCLLLLGLFFTRPLYRLNLYTFSDYFRYRFNKRVELVSALFMIPSYFSWIAAQLVAMAIILKAVAGIPFTAGVILCAVIVLFYTYIGGMWSISITDTIQTVLIILGLLFLAVQLYFRAGGWNAIQASVPDGFFRFIPRENTLNSWLVYFAAWITIGWGSVPQQDVFQRILSARSEKDAVQGSFLSAGMYLSIAMLPLLIILAGSILHPEFLKEDTQMFIPNLVLNTSGLFMQILFFGALLSAILSTCSAALLAPATVVAENFIKSYFGDRISDENLLKIMRYATVAITFIAILLSFNNSSIYELVGESSQVSLVALFIPLVGGLYWKRSNSAGAILSMVLGTFTWFLCLHWNTEIPPVLYGLAASISGMLAGVIFFKDK